MRLTVLGSSGTYPTPGNPASGYVVAGPGLAVLDLGPGTFPRLLDGGAVPDVIVLTHRHPDHCLDLLPLFNYLRYDRPDVRSVPLLAPSGVIERLASLVDAGPDHPFHQVFSVGEVSGGDSLQVAGFGFEFGEAVHPVPAVMVSVTDGVAKLTYSGDTGPAADLDRLARNADLLLCEATLQGEPGRDRYPFHMFASEAGRAAGRAGVGRLLVTHVAPTLDQAVSVAEAAAEFDGPVQHAAPGMEVVL